MTTHPTSAVTQAVKAWLSDMSTFSRVVTRKPLRQYQLEPARAIIDSILHGKGLTFAVMMSRQAGKNELSGQLEAYLLNLFRRKGGQVVKASPTFKPQTVNSIMRLEDRLHNPWDEGTWRRREGYIIELGRARVLFFSADPTSNVVGATADLLLEGDEAQDIEQAKWDKDFAPMAASTRATTVLWGTAWTSTTMLAQAIAALSRQQAQDGKRRVFSYDADQVGSEVPAYRDYVRDQVERLGRDHPLIKTQYYLESIDAQGGLFTPARRAMIAGDHYRQRLPEPGHRYAFLIDVAGEEEAAEGAPSLPIQLRFEGLAPAANKRRDATALTVIDIEPRPGALPIYRTVDRHRWMGVRHTGLHDTIVNLAGVWHPIWVVIDATGIGAGLASFLARSLGNKVIPIVFSPKVKSDLGWNWVGLIETGRYREYQPDDAPETRQFWYELGQCRYECSAGPGQAMKWGVWEPVSYDGLIAHGHDDMLISAALCTVIDRQGWTGTGPSDVVQVPDPLEAIDRARWS
jgi:Terminase RNaseH-like domain